MINKKNVNVKLIIDELHKAFNYINRDYFNNELPEPAILIQSRGNKKLVLGWCTVGKVWKNATTQEEKYEINLVAEAVNRGLYPVIATLMHEMVHLYNLENSIKDTSRSNTYHNKAFKAEAEKRGLIIEHEERIGWSLTSLSPALMNQIDKYGLNEDAFTLGRIDMGEKEKEKGKKKSSSRKYICPECGLTVRASKEVSLICGECYKLDGKIQELHLEIDPEDIQEPQGEEKEFSCNECGCVSNIVVSDKNEPACPECGSFNVDLLETLGTEEGEEGEEENQPIEDAIENENETEESESINITEVDDKLVDENGNLVDVKQGFIEVPQKKEPFIFGNFGSKTENTGWDEDRIRKIMKIAQEDIERINANEIEKHSLNSDDIELRFGRMKSEYGHVMETVKKVRGKDKIIINYIKLSKIHLEQDSDYEIIDTIRHEYIHAWLDTKRNAKQHHNELFKRYCEKMGVKIN